MSRSIFDDVVLGEIETATNASDVLEDEVKSLNDDEYTDDKLYFFCANIHPSFSLFIPVVLKEYVDNQVKKLQNKIAGVNSIEGKNEMINEALCVIIGCNNEFNKYKVKGGARLLERYSIEGKKEYKDFCNDVVLYNIYMKVFFNRPFEIWDPKKVEELGLL